jgi:hypothetical protein
VRASSFKLPANQSLVKILNLRFGSVNRAEIFKANLQTRVKRREESISELAQFIKKFTRQAYPNAPSTVLTIMPPWLQH